MTYSQLFANAGQPMPAQFTQFANVEIPADQLPAYLQQYPPVAQPQAPAAPAPAAVPPAPAVAAAPATPEALSDINNPELSRWPIIKRYDADTCEREGVLIIDVGGSPSRRHQGLTQYSAIVKGMVVRGEAIAATEVYTSSIFQNGQVVGYHKVEDCPVLVVTENPERPGDYRFKLQQSNLEKRLSSPEAKVVKLKPSINWAQFAAATDAVD